MSKAIRVLKLLYLPLVLVLVMSGCMRSEFIIELNEDGTGNVSSVAALSEELYNYLLESGSDPFEGYTTEKKVIDGETYICYTESLGKLTYEEIEDKLLGYIPDTENSSQTPLFKHVSIEKSGGLFRDEYKFELVTNKDAVGDIQGMAANEVLKVFLTIKMPGDVKSHNVKDNTVTIAIDDYSKENVYQIKSVVNNTMLVGILVILFFLFIIFVAVVVIVLVVVLKKKKKPVLQQPVQTFVPQATQAPKETQEPPGSEATEKPAKESQDNSS